MLQSWTLMSWPEVGFTLPPSPDEWPVFQHMGTHVRPDTDEFGRRVGDTLWAVPLEPGHMLGAAWEWVEVAPGSLAIRDPNGFISNAQLTIGPGQRLDELQSIAALNLLAHRSGWQPVVAQLIHHAERRPGVPGVASLRRQVLRLSPWRTGVGTGASAPAHEQRLAA